MSTMPQIGVHTVEAQLQVVVFIRGSLLLYQSFTRIGIDDIVRIVFEN